MSDFTAHWHWPQWTYLILLLLSLLIHGRKHGEPRDPYNGFEAMIAFGVCLFILICGGFFA